MKTTIPAPEQSPSVAAKLSPLALAALTNGVSLPDVLAYALSRNRLTATTSYVSI